MSGDKIRAVVTGRLRGGRFFPTVSLETVLETGYTVEYEILERADDPARDPVGTVRRFGDGDVRIVWVKTDRDEWQRTPRQGIRSTWRDAAMADALIIGAVPGTPAAVTAAEPVEITAESPEPDRSRVYVDSEGDRWSHGAGWQYSDSDWSWTWAELVDGFENGTDPANEVASFPWHLADVD